MAVVNVPTGFENLGADMGKLGQALALTLFPGTVKDLETEELIRQRPEIGKAMAQAVREGGAEALAAAGVSPRLAAQLETMFPAGFEERLMREVMNDPAAMKNFADEFKLRPEVGIAQGRAGISTAETAIEENVLRQEEIRHLRAADIPKLRILVEGGQLRQAGEMLAYADELGTIELEAIGRHLGIDLQNAQNRFQKEQLQQYQQFAKGLSPHLQGVALAAMFNPGLAGHILAHEQMSFEERMARMQLDAKQDGGAVFAQSFKMAMDLQDQIEQGLDRLRAANDEGNEDDRKAAVSQLQNLAGWNRTLVSEGLIPPGHVISAEMRDRLIRGGVGETFIEEPQFGDFILEGYQMHQQFLQDGTYAREVEAGRRQAVPNFADLVQAEPGWHQLPAADQRKVLADIAAGRPPELTGATRTRPERSAGNAQGATAPPRETPSAATGSRRASIAAQIAELERIPVGERTTEQRGQLINLKNQLRFTQDPSTAADRAQRIGVRR